jgi:hypothetical protein
MMARVPLLIIFQRALEPIAFLILRQFWLVGWLWSNPQTEKQNAIQIWNRKREG